MRLQTEATNCGVLRRCANIAWSTLVHEKELQLFLSLYMFSAQQFPRKYADNTWSVLIYFKIGASVFSILSLCSTWNFNEC